MNNRHIGFPSQADRRRRSVAENSARAAANCSTSTAPIALIHCHAASDEALLARRLNELMGNARITTAPGCFDALSAALIERPGFDCAYLCGASIAYTRFSRPDIGLISMSGVAGTISVIRERTGFGNAVNTYRTVQLYERMGASAIQLEDQVMPRWFAPSPSKPCSFSKRYAATATRAA